MSPNLSAAIYAARELAWEPTHNLSDRKRYARRNELHRALVTAIARMPRRYMAEAASSPELRFLIEALIRVSLCSFANRKGAPYYERKTMVAELRGCLLAYDRSREVAA